MYRTQPYKEDVELMKRGRKRKAKSKTKPTTTTRTKGVNIKNIINISRGGGGQRRRPPAFSPAVNVPYSNLFRPQSNEPRSTAVTSASSAEQNNNILASIQKTQEISEGKLRTEIKDLGSMLAENLLTTSEKFNDKLENINLKLQRKQRNQSVKQQESGLMRQKSGDDKQKPSDFMSSFTPSFPPSSSSRTPTTPRTPTISAPTEPTASKKKSGRPPKQPKRDDEQKDE